MEDLLKHDEKKLSSISACLGLGRSPEFIIMNKSGDTRGFLAYFFRILQKKEGLEEK